MADAAMADSFKDFFAKEAQIEYKESVSANLMHMYKMGTLKWSTDAGDIPISNMTNTHVENCYNRLSKESNPDFVIATWIEIFDAELIKRNMK